MQENYTDIVTYSVILLVLSGITILWLDVKIYVTQKNFREVRAARVMGWLNILLGTVLMVTIWTYNKFF